MNRGPLQFGTYLALLAMTACPLAGRAEDEAVKEETKRRWKEYNKDDSGYDGARFDAAAGPDGVLTWDEAVRAHLAGEEVGGRERFNRAAGADGVVTREEARRHLDREAAHRKEIYDAWRERKEGAPTDGGIPGSARPGPGKEPSDHDERLEDGWKKAYTDGDGPHGYREERYDRYADLDGEEGMTKDEARQGARPWEKDLAGGRRFDKAAGEDGILEKGEARSRLDKEKSHYKEHRDNPRARERVRNRRNR